MKHQLNTNSNNDPPNPPAAAYTANPLPFTVYNSGSGLWIAQYTYKFKAC